MKKTVVEKFRPPYSLHDMNITGYEADGNSIVLRTDTGIVQSVPPYGQHNGYVVLLRHTADNGVFTGEMRYLTDFVKNFGDSSYTVMDTTYCGDITKFSGFLSVGDDVVECIIDIYHEGDMVFVDEEM